MEYIASALGTSPAGIRLLVSLLAGYPLAIVHRKWTNLNSGNVQHLFFSLSGLLLLFYNFGWDATHTLINITVTYAVLMIAGRTQIGLAFNFIFCMTYLLLGYYYTATESYDIKWTMPQCVLCLRLIGVAFDYYDGKVNDIETLSADRRATVLVNLPTPLEMMGHSFFYGGVLVGPQFSMRRYQQFIAKELWTGQKYENADSMPYAINRLLLGLGSIGFYQLGCLIVDDDFLLTSNFLDASFFKRWFILGLYSTVTFHKYFGCWLLSEGSCALTGLAYDREENGVKSWDGLKNISLWQIEFTTNFDGYIRYFNINTNKWVAQYIFKRLRFLGNKDFSQFATLAFLALWHGFHFGYYVTFLMEFIVMKFERDFYAFVKMIPALENILYSDALKWQRLIFMKLWVATLIGYCLVPFTLLSWSKFHQVYATFYYLPTIILLVWFFASFSIMPLLKRKTKKFREVQEVKED